MGIKMASLKILNLSEANLLSKTDSAKGYIPGLDFFYVDLLTITMLGLDDSRFSCRSSVGEVGLFEHDLGLMSTLEKVKGRDGTTCAGIFTLVSEDIYSFSMQDSYKAVLVGLVVGQKAFIPKSSKYYHSIPLDSLRVMGLEIVRDCPFSVTQASKKLTALTQEEIQYTKWFNFFKTPTKNWGEEKSNYYVDPCECGAKYTSFPDIHLFFCDLYQNPND
jgi:hypothetical protein